MIGKIVSINISKNTGTKKVPIKTAILKKNCGIVGDVHYKTKRPLSLLSWDDVEKWQKKLKTKIVLKYGIFAENISLKNISLKKVTIGNILTINNKIKLKIIAIGKRCHSKCEIKKIAGSCIMPKFGIFAKVLSGGKICVGDIVKLNFKYN